MAEKRYGWAINEALKEEMRRDPKVCLLGEDVGLAGGVFGVTRGLLQEFGPDRVKDTPISESALVGLAVGAATLGLRPVVEIMFMDFIGLAMDQIANQAAKIRYMFGGQAKLPLVIRTQCGAGFSAGPQHSQSLEAWFVHVPGLIVAMPATPYDAKGLLKSAIRDDNPVIFIEHKGLYATRGEVPEEEYLVPLGVAEVKREGSEVTVVATSRMVLEALAAAEVLAGRGPFQEGRGIALEVVDPRTLSPLDEDTILASVRKTGRLVVAHEAVRVGGFGAEVAALAAEKAFGDLRAPIQRVGALSAPIPFSPPLEKAVVPGRDQIICAVEEVMKWTLS